MDNIQFQIFPQLSLSASRAVQEIVQLVDCITQKKSSDYQVSLCTICVSISEKDITGLSHGIPSPPWKRRVGSKVSCTG